MTEWCENIFNEAASQSWLRGGFQISRAVNLTSFMSKKSSLLNCLPERLFYLYERGSSKGKYLGVIRGNLGVIRGRAKEYLDRIAGKSSNSVLY